MDEDREIIKDNKDNGNKLSISNKRAELSYNTSNCPRKSQNWLGVHWARTRSSASSRSIPTLYSGKGCDLDPKCAQLFNPKTVREHFEQLAKTTEEFVISPGNLYNWNEKGLCKGSKAILYLGGRTRSIM